MTGEEHLQTARSRAHHLAIALSATAAGVFEPKQAMLDALALLGWAVVRDLEAAA